MRHYPESGWAVRLDSPAYLSEMINRVVLLSFFLSVLLSGTMNSQAVTIDRESVKVGYYRLPQQPLPASYSTYSGQVVSYDGGLLRAGVTPTTLERDYLVLDGYTRAATRGDVEIEANVGDFVVLSERREYRQKKTKKKDGTEVIEQLYWMEVKYSLPVSMSVTDKSGRVLDDRFIYRLSDSRLYSSPQHSSISSLDSYWRLNRTRQLNDLHEDLLTEAFRKIRDEVNLQFGYTPVTGENARFETIGKKRHEDYDKFNAALETIRHGFEQMHPDMDLVQVKKAVAPAFTFYEKQEKMYTTRSKDNDRLRHICLYNLALGNFWIEEFTLADQYAKALLKLDPKDKDAENLLEENQRVQELLKQAGRTTRHEIRVGGKS